jgi:hypothetical protein
LVVVAGEGVRAQGAHESHGGAFRSHSARARELEVTGAHDQEVCLWIIVASKRKRTSTILASSIVVCGVWVVVGGYHIRTARYLILVADTISIGVIQTTTVAVQDR